MRPRTFGLVAALFALAFAPLAAQAQDSQPAAAAAKPAKKAKPVKVEKVPEANLKRGMAEAPALLAGLNVSCQLEGARFVGEQKGKTPLALYEVDCASGPGYMLQATKDQPTVAYSCYDSEASPNPCVLPGNVDRLGNFAPLMQKAGRPCTATDIRAIGATKTNSFLEVACQDGSGYILQASAPLDPAKDVLALNCLQYDDEPVDANLKCKLSTKAQHMGIVDRLVVEAKNNCVIKDRRFVGTAQGGTDIFETSCQDGKGYLYRVTADGKYAENWDCARGQNILGGCTLTDARQAATEQAGLYTKLVAQAGGSCDVERYALFPIRDRTEVVEMVCKSGASGIGIFPASGKGQYLDCGASLAAGYRCSLAPGAGNAELTTALRKFRSDSTCVVADKGALSKLENGDAAVEVTCTDKLKGYVILYDGKTHLAKDAIGCALSNWGRCKMPGNL